MALIPETLQETKNETIPRSFYYYDIKPFKKDDSENLVEIKDSEDVFYNTFERIDELLRKNDLDNVSINLNSGDTIFVIPDEIERGAPIKFRIVLVRKNGFPLVEKEGALRSLTAFIDDDFGLAEITHCVIFPDCGILGAEYNHSGARATAIKQYLPRVSIEIAYMYCTPHIQKDMLKYIIDNKELSLFQLEVKNTLAMKEYIANNTSIFLLPFLGIPSVGKYEIVLKQEKKNKRFESPMKKDEMKQFIESCRDDIVSFKVSQEECMKDAVNLLGQKVVHKTGVLRTKNKSIDKKAAYKIIVDYFNDSLKDTL